ncbi:MAG: phage tail protein [Hyphomicrobiales bacterium]|nr:MAG: phage tail protein [Hyphomicrobiales bacterium]
MIDANTIKYMMIDGDRLDLIIYNHYGIEPEQLSGALDFILDHNSHLAGVKQPFKMGSAPFIIELPPLPVFEQAQEVNLWS